LGVAVDKLGDNHPFWTGLDGVITLRLMNKRTTIIVAVLLGSLAIVPLICATIGVQYSWLTTQAIAGLNLLAWSVVLTLFFARADHHRQLTQVAKDMGLGPQSRSLEKLLDSMLSEIRRKQSALSVGLADRRISSKEELSRALERVVAMAYRLLHAESAELALFDREAGLYHSSFVLGKPFRSSAQAMLSGDGEGNEELSPDVLVAPIGFAGSVHGSLRVGLKKGRLPTTADQDLLGMLALQGGLAIVNAQYTGELLQMKRVSEESIKAKTGFLANLSHELRGPLGIMLNSVELVLDGLCGAVNADQTETLRMVRQNGEHLLELINDVLDYAKIESGKVTPQRVDILVNDLLADICAVVRTQADAKGHKLTFNPHTEALAISSDRRHIRQILINMLTNAIKYTPDNGTIEVTADRAAGGKVKISVKDSGIGIKDGDRHKVFSAFERIENSYSIKQVGTGLGMPLTKRLIELNGGMIDFISAPNEGTTFWFVMPSIEYDPTTKSDQPVEPPRIDGNGEVLAVLERSESERNMMVRSLTARGYKVLGSATLPELTEILVAEKVSLIIIDNDMLDDPEEGIVESLRASERSRSVPIVLLSSRAFVFDVERYLRMGIDRCIAKPIRFNEFAQTCRELISARSSIEAGSAANKTDSKVNKPKILKSGMNPGDDLLH